MIPEVVDEWLLVAYATLLGFTLVQYVRDKVPFERAVLLVSMCLTWLSYELLQVTADGLVANGAPLHYALEGFALVLLAGGLYGLYWYWRHGKDGRDSGVALSGE
ncbi:hypothetical protein C453_14928 [Haloferax elongans ATCC BAA-1513]|uniref:Uncharacterized protein n=1 Tax=Haloferax elongans ATCC BAA-1513 TaxID=1230453 RepID=M0HH23_HALEO|nr:hypothetical protein [Haloferax elongans]ELZ82389.1 hypothetical protein C453_14928 [Haloferax elongans ATCC BAA-1513]